MMPNKDKENSDYILQEGTITFDDGNSQVIVKGYWKCLNESVLLNGNNYVEIFVGGKITYIGISNQSLGRLSDSVKEKIISCASKLDIKPKETMYSPCPRLDKEPDSQLFTQIYNSYGDLND